MELPDRFSVVQPDTNVSLVGTAALSHGEHYQHGPAQVALGAGISPDEFGVGGMFADVAQREARVQCSHHEVPEPMGKTAGSDHLPRIGVGEARTAVTQEHRGVHRGDHGTALRLQHAMRFTEEPFEIP